MPRESVLLLRAPAAALHTTAVLLPLPPPPPPRASHSAACWLWPRGLSARVSPAGPLRRTRVSFTLSFLGKSVVLTSTMSSKHSYARSGERGEKREDGQQGERGRAERGEGHGERRASKQLDRTRGIDEGIQRDTRRGKREERREESKERTEQNREETGKRREERESPAPQASSTGRPARKDRKGGKSCQSRE